jgi:hypothetical protein
MAALLMCTPFSIGDSFKAEILRKNPDWNGYIPKDMSFEEYQKAFTPHQPDPALPWTPS